MGDGGGELVRPPFLRRLRCTGGLAVCWGLHGSGLLHAHSLCNPAERQGPAHRPEARTPAPSQGLRPPGRLPLFRSRVRLPRGGPRWARTTASRQAVASLALSAASCKSRSEHRLPGPLCPHAHPDGQAQPLGGFPVPEELPRTRGSALPASRSALLCAAGILRPRERKGLSRTPQPGSGKGAIVSHHPAPPSPLLDSTCFSPGSSPSGRL